MEQPTDRPSVLAQFTPSLRMERFDEVTWYDDATTARPTQRTYEKLWEGQCGPDFPFEDSVGSETVRPVRLRVRWFENGDTTPHWNSIEVTAHVVLPDGGLDDRPIREIWTCHHVERGQVPDGFTQFVSANSPATPTTTAG